MKFIKSSYEILTDINEELFYKTIERTARLCYKSEDKITEDTSSAIKLIKNLLKNGHEAMIEHAPNIQVKFICDRGISHELVRHRLFSFAQECLTGDVKVRKDITIKELYDRQVNGTCYDKTHNKTLHLRSSDDNGKIIPHKMDDIIYTGKNNVYRVTTKRGYTITSTDTHKYMIDNNKFKELKDLAIGDTVMVNGRKCLLKINDNILSNLYLKEGLSPYEIAENFNVPYHTVVRKLKQIDIFKSRLNDKNKEKYNKNHTSESYEKIRQKNLENYANGATAWNKGLSEHDHPSVKRQADNLRKVHHNNGYGKNNSNYKYGTTTPYSQFVNSTSCEVCESSENLELHHKDKNRKNNTLNNLIKVCENCHSVFHFGWHVGNKITPDIITNIEYIGIEDTYDIIMTEPYHNFIANGFVVHNSQRYVNYKNNDDIEFIIPNNVHPIHSLALLDLDDTRDELIFDVIDNDSETDRNALTAFILSCKYAEDTYKHLIQNNWTPQYARSVLPNTVKTEIIVTGNIREWRNFFKLRVDKSAHPQMRELTIPLLKELCKKLPILFGDICLDIVTL